MRIVTTTLKDVAGRHVLVTGAAMGMGRLFVERAIAERAATVVLWDIDADALARTADELDPEVTRVRTDVVDVSDRAAVAAVAEAVLEDVGVIEVLVNNAGVVRGNHYFWETDTERDMAFTMGVNALGPMTVARELLAESAGQNFSNGSGGAGSAPVESA